MTEAVARAVIELAEKVGHAHATEGLLAATIVYIVGELARRSPARWDDYDGRSGHSTGGIGIGRSGSSIG